MNKVFLIGKIITDIYFKFIISSKDISIARFKIATLDKQIVPIKAYNEMADYAYRKLNRNNLIDIEGKLEKDTVVTAFMTIIC